MARVEAVDGGHAGSFGHGPARILHRLADTHAVVALGAATAVSTAATVGRGALAPVVFVAVIAVACGIWDRHESRIPNPLVAAGVIAVAVSWGPVSMIDGVPAAAVGRDLLVGCLLSGAPVVFAVWAVAPRLIGGGDWKLLGLCGGATGYLAPAAAVLIGAVGFGAAAVTAVVTRRRQVVLGPALALGYTVAVVAALTAPELLGVDA